MKIKIYIICAFITLSCTSATKTDEIPDYNNKIETVYKGFFSLSSGKNINQLMFTIYNKTNDTLYLSYANFKVEMYKNDKILMEDTSLNSHNIIYDFIQNYTFLSDNLSKLTLDERALKVKKVEIIKRAFSEKLYKKYLKEQKSDLSYFDKTRFLNSVYNNCIVLLPKETISESFLFYNNSLNHDCTAKAFYLNNKVFMTYMDENNKKIVVQY
jgi:hypothetical protein